MRNMLTQEYRGHVGHDVMQVCLNGHRITAYAFTKPEFRQDFCDKCGEATIDKCPACSSSIRGKYHSPNVFVAKDVPVPAYCHGCGKPYPWQEAAIANLKDVLREGELSDADIAAAEATLPDVLRDTPKSEAAALRLKRIMGGLGKPVYDVAIKVVSDIASETAKKTMGL